MGIGLLADRFAMKDVKRKQELLRITKDLILHNLSKFDQIQL